ncbi:unnamed protein product [Ectocarpus sp. 12 AP-2014]
MEDYAQQFMVFGDVYAHQAALAAVEQQPDLDSLWHPVHEQLVVALTKLRASRYSDVTVEGHAFPRDFMPGMVCPCSPERVAKLQASSEILLSNGHLLLRGIEGLNLGDTCYKRFRSEAKFLLLATFICSGLQHGSEVLYDNVLRANVQLNDLEECHEKIAAIFPKNALQLMHGLLAVYRHISGNPAQHGAGVSARAATLYTELGEKCTQGGDAMQNLEAKGDTARLTAVDAELHSGITEAFGSKVNVDDRQAAGNEGVMDESA